jgi:translation initiation factor IF-2
MEAMAQQIEIGEMITVGALADKLSLPATKLIAELFKNGVMVTINENIDVDTAQILVDELGLDIQLINKISEDDKENVVNKEIVFSKNAKSRPPVVAVMGHVDHGKTSLLDVIRKDNVADHEAGGITQHISAYQVKKNDRLITFLDTPGHEAFSALREHGAYLTDVVIIVIAADDGVKPQTLEAIRFANKANVKIVVAITKIDKEGANIERIKQQLVEQKMTPEEWGGDIVVVPISSKTKEGIDKLLDMVLLVADIEELKADIDVPGEGLVIESHMEQGRGPVAIALVQQGTLKRGDFVVAGNTYAKIRVLEDAAGNKILKAGPSTPVIIIGFKSLPEFGNHFNVVKNEKAARQQVLSNTDISFTKIGQSKMTSSDLIKLINKKTALQELNVIVKADVQGSLTSVVDSLKTLNTDEVAVRVVGSGVGGIIENDVRMAATSQAIIYGFQVSIPSNIKQLAARNKVSIRLYKIIYELLDDAKQELSGLLQPEEIVTNVGRLLVRGVFKTTKNEIICGGEVTKGKIVLPALATVYRNNEIIGKDLEITNLKHGPTDTKEVLEGEMCGMNIATTNRIDLQEGDRIEVFAHEVRQRTL